MGRSSERNAKNYESHKAIFEAIVERDSDAAESHLETQLENARDQIKDTFDVGDEQ